MTEDMKVLFEEGVLFEGCDWYLMDYDRIAEEAAVRPTLFMDTFTRSIGDIPLKGLYNIDAVQLAVWGGELAHLIEDLDAYLDSGYTVCILAGTEKAGRALTSDLVGKGYNADYAADLPALTPKKIYVLPAACPRALSTRRSNWRYSPTDGWAASLKKRRKTKQKSDPIRSLADLTPGDYVVHVTHGIGVFEGIIKREIHGVVKDYIKIRYGRHRYALCAGHPAGSGVQVHRRRRGRRRPAQQAQLRRVEQDQGPGQEGCGGYGR